MHCIDFIIYMWRFGMLRGVKREHNMLANCYYAGFLLDLFFCSEDGGDIFLQNYFVSILI
jgi:hypothetical protein